MRRVYRGKSHSKTLFQKKRSITFLLFTLACALIALIAFAVLDGTQVRVELLTVTLPSLPRAFEGYTVALISDLNGRSFGEKQESLLSALSSYKYDAVLILGDMADARGDSTAFLDLLDGLNTAERTVFFVPGELDPPMFEMKNGVYAPTAFLESLVARNVTYLELPVPITLGDSTIWMTPAARLGQDTDTALASVDLAIQHLNDNMSLSAEDKALELAKAMYKRDLYLQLAVINAGMQPEHVQLALAHYPLTPELMDTVRHNVAQSSSVDIVFAGHFIGGGWRVPLLGAPHVDAPALTRKGWFPDQKDVSGLNEISGAFQYISPGLGARGWLRLRLFNPPTVPIIRLSSLWHQ